MPTKIETVIFLGAGASAADGAPVQSNLFSSYFSEPESRQNSLKDFFKDFFGIDTSNLTDQIKFPTFEEV